MATAIGSDAKLPFARAPRMRPIDGQQSAADAALIETLAAAALAGDDTAITEALDGAIGGEGTLDRLLVGPVTDAARRLGDFWIEDSCDFVTVTMASWHLRRGVERVVSEQCTSTIWSGRRALFAAVPGDQHGFGSFLVSEVFARAGWLASVVGTETLATIVADEWIELVGLTASADRHCMSLATTITALRRASRNPRLAIVVGGRVFVDDPARAVAIGADGTAPDAITALALADRLVASPGAPC